MLLQIHQIFILMIRNNNIQSLKMETRPNR